MTSTAGKGKERVANVALAVVAIIGLLVPVIVGVIVGITTDTTLRVADAGTFASLSTSAGGYWSPAATTVQTSTGSIVVWGPLSAVRGQRLRIEDRLKSGLHLCVQTTPPTCADVAGQWTGQMQPVQHQRHASAWFAEHIGMSGAALWFLLGLIGLIATFIAIVVLDDAGGLGDEPEPEEVR